MTDLLAEAVSEGLPRLLLYGWFLGAIMSHWRWEWS